MKVNRSADQPIINWDQKADGFGEKLFQAIEYLKFRTTNFNAAAAYRTIERFVAEQQKYLLFRRFFPAQWESSKTSLFRPGTYENYSERTNEFLELVNEHLFPVLRGWNEDPESEFDDFNIYSLNIDFCCDDVELEYLNISYVAALLFFSGEDDVWDYLAEQLNVKKEDFPEINRYSFDNIWKLEKTGNRGLYLNIWEIVDHSTGNPWLDNANCQYYEKYSWDENTVRLLSESYSEAQELLEKTHFLDELIEGNPGQVLNEMISLWNTGRTESD